MDVILVDVSTSLATSSDNIASHILLLPAASLSSTSLAVVVAASFISTTMDPSLSTRNTTPRSSNHACCSTGGNSFVNNDVTSFLPRGYPSFNNSRIFFEVSWRMPPLLLLWVLLLLLLRMVCNTLWVDSYTFTSIMEFDLDVDDDDTFAELLFLWRVSRMEEAANMPLVPPPMIAMRYFSLDGNGGGYGDGGNDGDGDGGTLKAHAWSLMAV
mmetsp:Transcript_18960/g.35340  ORF Transcript_18960/g.35340 Transcript_18960/m.35340 type:complete len:213 (+) Transcript_18960:392-1030(+)